MDNEKLRELANKIVDGLKSGEIEFDVERWPHEIAFTPQYLKEKFEGDRENHGEDFQEYLEWQKDLGRIKWSQERLEAFARAEALPNLEELNEYASHDPDDYDPDFLMFVPLVDGGNEVGCAVIKVNGVIFYEFSLEDVFSNIEAARKYVDENWCFGWSM
jgi:hypothetical protein